MLLVSVGTVRSVSDLNIATLNLQRITSIGDTEWLGRHMKSLSEIDLTDNGISDWQQVCQRLMHPIYTICEVEV